MAVTKEQRRAALIALSLLASAGGGYVAKDELIAIGQHYCGPVPKAVLELDQDLAKKVYEEVSGFPSTNLLITEVAATPQNIDAVNKLGPKGVKVKLDLGKAQGLLAAWCDPDRQRLDDTVDLKLTKGAQ